MSKMTKKLCVIEIGFDSYDHNEDSSSIDHMIGQVLATIEEGYVVNYFDSPHSGDICRFRIIEEKDRDYRDIATTSETFEYARKAANMVSDRINNEFEGDDFAEPLKIGYGSGCLPQHSDKMIFVHQHRKPVDYSKIGCEEKNDA